MSILTKIKNWFGFGFPPEDEDDDFRQPETTQQPHKPQSPQPLIPTIPEAPLQVSAEMMSMIFDKVVEVTNASVPQYFANSLNPDKQKKFLYESLDASIKDYLASLEARAEERCRARWQNESNQLKQEAEQLRQRARDLEAKRNEINEQKLSADRQRRALNERVQDLQSTVLKLEADKEQLEIQNLGLINKAKVVAVYENDLEEMRKQVEEYRRKADATELNEENNALKQQIAALQAEITKLSDACEAAKVKDQMEGAMLNDLQKRASDSIQSAKESYAKIDELQSALALKDAQIDDLKKQLDEKSSQLEEDAETISAIEQLAEQLDQFEELKKKYQDRIRSLKSELQESKNEAENLRTTIKNNLYAHAQQEKKLIDEIDRLKNLAER